MSGQFSLAQDSRIVPPDAVPLNCRGLKRTGMRPGALWGVKGGGPQVPPSLPPSPLKPKGSLKRDKCH